VDDGMIIEIPEFMKNDLDQLRVINNFKKNPYELLHITREIKLRNHMYYILARAFKFGHDPKALMVQFDFIGMILGDLSNVKHNTSIFPNLMLMMQNLSVIPNALKDLIWKNIDTLISIIFEIPAEFSFFKESLLKVLIDITIKNV
jgi:hypothetical protein